jgi:hypothetical protein
MTWRAWFAFVVFVAAADGGQNPLEIDRTGLLEEARRAALDYSRQLPDFICTETIHRYQAYGPAGAFRGTDLLTLQVSYFQLHEDYKLVARNNRATRQGLESVAGALTEGEFGSALRLIFHPDSKAEFQFKEWKNIGEHRAAVFIYRVERANSHFELRLPTESVIAGYHGEVSIDSATHLVLRIEEIIDVPEGAPLQYSSLIGTYSFVKVNGRPYLLPARWESVSADLPVLSPSPVQSASGGGTIIHPLQDRQFPGSTTASGRKSAPDTGPQPGQQVRYRNVIEFRDYRRYVADSTLNFGNGKQER